MPLNAPEEIRLPTLNLMRKPDLIFNISSVQSWPLKSISSENYAYRIWLAGQSYQERHA